jgi:hypothetical protein
MSKMQRHLERVILSLEDIHDEARFVDPNGRERMERAIAELKEIYLLDG